MRRIKVWGPAAFALLAVTAACGSGSDDPDATTATTAIRATTSTAAELTTTTAAGEPFVKDIDQICIHLDTTLEKLDTIDVGAGDFETGSEVLQSMLDEIHQAESSLAALAPPPEAQEVVLIIQEGMHGLDVWITEMRMGLDAHDSTAVQEDIDVGPDVDVDEFDRAVEELADLGATNCSSDSF